MSSQNANNGLGEENGDGSEINPEAEFAQAFKDLARGEQTATALENQLASIEQKIEELLARADKEQKELENSSQQEQSSTAAEHASQEKNDQK